MDVFECLSSAMSSSLLSLFCSKLLSKSFLIFALVSASSFINTPAFALRLLTPDPLIVGIHNDLWPCSQKADVGYQGSTMDIWEKIATKHSLSYELKPFSTMEELVVATSSNEVDLVASCHIISAERASRVDFSVPISYSSIAILSRRKEVPSLQFASRVLTNARVARSLFILLVVTFAAVFIIKRQVEDDLSFGRIWTILILGSGVHSLLSNRKRSHFPILGVTALRLILVSILVGTTASIVFDEDKPMDASTITRKQFNSLISDGVGTISRTTPEDWARKKMSDLSISTQDSRINVYSSEDTMLESLRAGTISHVISYYSRLPYYLNILDDSSSYYASYVIDANTPVAFMFGADLPQPLRRLINSELASLNQDGTITRIEKYWSNSLD